MIHPADCAFASLHHWSRQLKALGHTVRLMPPAYVKPYVKRQKNDAADAAAICDPSPGEHAVRCDKTPEQDSCLGRALVRGICSSVSKPL